MLRNAAAFASILATCVVACSGSSTSDPEDSVTAPSPVAPGDSTTADDVAVEPSPDDDVAAEPSPDASDDDTALPVEASPGPAAALDDCVSGAGRDELLASAPAYLPSTLKGTLCDAADSLWLVVEPPLQATLRARLRSGEGAYTLSVFKSVDGVVEPLKTDRDTNSFTLSSSEPEVVFADRYGAFVPTPRLALQLEGPPGEVAVDLEEVALAPFLECDSAYESTPVTTAPSALPATFDAEICSARDSRVRAFEVTSGRAVTVTLENPESIEAARVNVIHADANFELVAVSAGTNESTLGLLARSAMTFTPEASGAVALYLSGTLSRGEPMRLLVEQE